MYKTPFYRLVNGGVIYQKCKYEQGDNAQHIDTSAMSCCVISEFWYLLFLMC